MKFQQKIQAIKLREAGKSYSEIRKTIKVSKASLSLWLRDITLTPEQQKRIYVELRQKNAYRMAKANQTKRINTTREIVEKGKKEAAELFKNPLFLSGLMLYWAEGDKSETQERVKFTNSDPRMIKIIMRWFREVCKVPDSKFRVCVYIHNLHARKNIEKYWSEVTDVPTNQFHKTQIKETTLGQRRNVLYEGTCAITVSDKSLFRKIKGWKLGFIEKIDTIKL